MAGARTGRPHAVLLHRHDPGSGLASASRGRHAAALGPGNGRAGTSRITTWTTPLDAVGIARPLADDLIAVARGSELQVTAIDPVTHVMGGAPQTVVSAVVDQRGSGSVRGLAHGVAALRDSGVHCRPRPSRLGARRKPGWSSGTTAGDLRADRAVPGRPPARLGGSCRRRPHRHPHRRPRSRRGDQTDARRRQHGAGVVARRTAAVRRATDLGRVPARFDRCGQRSRGADADRSASCIPSLGERGRPDTRVHRCHRDHEA